MWYDHECQSDNSPSKSQFVKANLYRSKYSLQHGAYYLYEDVWFGMKDSAEYNDVDKSILSTISKI